MVGRLKILCVVWAVLFSGLIVTVPLSTQVKAGTPVTGNITIDTFWNLNGTPYWVESDIDVDVNATLTIEAGVEVKFDGRYSLFIYGQLVANGNEAAKIVFTSNSTSPGVGDWEHVEVKQEGRAVMDFVEVSYGYGVFILGSNSSITNSTFVKNWAGIGLWGSSNTLIYNNIMAYNGDGITGDNGVTNGTIERNAIVGNDRGMVLNASRNTKIRSNLVSSNGAYGIYLIEPSGNTITCNNISWNGWAGIYMLHYTPVVESHIYHNNIFSTGTHAIDWMGSNFWNNSSEGNYWSDYSGSDPDGDGIGNEPYVIDEDSQDNYPLVSPVTFCDIPDENIPPIADAEASKYLADENEIIGFYGNDSFDPDGTIVNYTWDFGDSTEGYGVYTTHSYSHSGLYLVSLAIEDNDGGTDTDCFWMTVKDFDNEPPVAIAKPDYQEVNVGEQAHFFGNLSYDVDGYIAQYRWNFGDSHVGYGAEVNHTYSQAGEYTVTLTVLDDDGSKGQDTCIAKVLAIPVNQPPVAIAQPLMQTVYVGETAWFYGNASYDPDGTIVNYTWNFGDNSTEGWGEMVSHIYNQPGNYTIALTVTDNDNATDTDFCYVLVLPSPPVPKDAHLVGTDMQDLLIIWELSPDDGAGKYNFSNYAIYYSNTYDRNGNNYRFLAETPAGQNSYLHHNVGDGDWDNYFYYVQANDTKGFFAWEGQVGKFVRHLNEGLQLASIPLTQSNAALEVVLQTLKGSYEFVRSYNPSNQTDSWKSYWTFKTYGDLYEIDEKMGFWIKMTKEDDLVVAGKVPNTTIHLLQGWNLVSYPSFIEKTVGDSLSGIDYVMVNGFGDISPFYTVELVESDLMRPGEGYWIWVDSDQIWEI